MIDLDEFALSTHEEADTMIFVHANRQKDEALRES